LAQVLTTNNQEVGVPIWVRGKNCHRYNPPGGTFGSSIRSRLPKSFRHTPANFRASFLVRSSRSLRKWPRPSLVKTANPPNLDHSLRWWTL